MSQENVEIVRRVMAATETAMERGDPAAAFPAGVFAVDFEWVLPFAFEGKTVWTGVEECVEFRHLDRVFRPLLVPDPALYRRKR